MNFVVCVKQVPDTVAKIEVRDGRIVEQGLAWVANPYDEYALEEALRLRDKFSGRVTLVSVGPERVKQVLKDGLARGADEAVHCAEPAFDGLDSFGVAAVLAAAVRKIGYDMIWCGWKGIDSDAGQTAIILAEMLGVPHLSFVTKIEAQSGKALIERDAEGGREVLEASLPAVLTAQKGLNEPRYPSIKGIMAAKRKIIPVWSAADLGLDLAALKNRKVETVRILPPPERLAGRIISGTPEEAAREVVRLLREEAKVIR